MAIKLDRKYEDDFKTKLIQALIGVVIGVLLFFIPIENIIPVITVVLAVLLLIFGTLNLLTSYNDNSTYGRYKLYTAVFQLILGVILLIFRGGIINIIAGIFLVIIPIIKIILAKDHLNSLKNEILSILIGLFIILFGIGNIVMYIRWVCGGLVILYSLYCLFLAYKDYRKAKSEDKVIDASYKEIDSK